MGRHTRLELPGDLSLDGETRRVASPPRTNLTSFEDLTGSLLEQSADEASIEAPTTKTRSTDSPAFDAESVDSIEAPTTKTVSAPAADPLEAPTTKARIRASNGNGNGATATARRISQITRSRIPSLRRSTQQAAEPGPELEPERSLPPAPPVQRNHSGAIPVVEPVREPVAEPAPEPPRLPAVEPRQIPSAEPAPAAGMRTAFIDRETATRSADLQPEPVLFTHDNGDDGIGAWLDDEPVEDEQAAATVTKRAPSETGYHRAVGKDSVRRGIAGWPIAVLAVVAVIGLGVFGVIWGINNLGAAEEGGAGCTEGKSTLRVVAPAKLAETLSDVGAKWNASQPVVDARCVTVDVTASSPKAALKSIKSGGDDVPAVWIAASTEDSKRLDGEHVATEMDPLKTKGGSEMPYLVIGADGVDKVQQRAAHEFRDFLGDKGAQSLLISAGYTS